MASLVHPAVIWPRGQLGSHSLIYGEEGPTTVRTVQHTDGLGNSWYENFAKKLPPLPYSLLSNFFSIREYGLEGGFLVLATRSRKVEKSRPFSRCLRSCKQALKCKLFLCDLVNIFKGPPDHI